MIFRVDDITSACLGSVGNNAVTTEDVSIRGKVVKQRVLKASLHTECEEALAVFFDMVPPSKLRCYIELFGIAHLLLCVWLASLNE